MHSLILRLKWVALKVLTAREVRQYIRYIADRRLMQLGLKEIYLVDNNPLPWLDEILNGVEHTNFFENRVTEYTKAATTGSWEDVFDAMDGNSDPAQEKLFDQGV
jgi:ribonucleoside-diphosphate reductase beta chain